MRRHSLLGQVLTANLLVVCAAVVVAGAAAGLDLDIQEQRQNFLILAMAMMLTIVLNIWVLQRRFSPLEHLIETMEEVDLARPRKSLAGDFEGAKDSREVERLEQAFVRMLERLEAERRRAGRIALQAQEEERTRVARDLHDEVNQALTGVLLHLEAARAKAPPELVGELAETKALANRAMDELLSLARQLRPTVLDDHGLRAALAGLVEEHRHTGALDATLEAEGDLAQLPDEVQLVIYRVSQEALSNVAQHARAEHAEVRIRCDDGRVELSIADDGRGFPAGLGEQGLGLAGMRERARMIDGELSVESIPGRGTTVRLTTGG